MAKKSYLFEFELIEKFPEMNGTAREWLSTINDLAWVKEYFSWLNREMCFFSLRDRRDILFRALSKGENSFHESVAEIVFAAFWRYLGWQCKKNPKIGELTPDFKVKYDKLSEKSFLCDVSVVRQNHPHHKILIDEDNRIFVNGVLSSRLPLVTAPIDQAKRFIMKVDEKMNKYVDVLHSEPFVMALFQYDFENNFYLDDFQARTALYGEFKFNFSDNTFSYSPLQRKENSRGIVEKGIFGHPFYEKLSAVIICRQNFEELENIRNPDGPRQWKSIYDISVFLNQSSALENAFSGSGFECDRVTEDSMIELGNPKTISFY